MRLLNIIILSCFTVLLTACDKPQSVDWYKEHTNEMNKLYEKCKSSGEDTQTCKNVKEAHFQIQQKNAPITDFNDVKMPDFSKSKRQNE